MKLDFSVLEKFDFQQQPVGIRFLYDKPEGIDRLKEKCPFCCMLTEAHKGEAFYAGKEDHLCEGTFALGQQDIPPYFGSGAVVAEVGQVEAARAGLEVYRSLPKLEKGTTNYVAFAPLSKLSFEPDVLICTGTIEQAQILLKASTYTTGRLWTSKMSVVLGCAWLYVYPFISGEVNYMVMGINAGGMTAYELLPVGQVIVSIPFNRLQTTLSSLRDMPWKPLSEPPEHMSEAMKGLISDQIEYLTRKSGKK
jgi:uncharacterized protein (DUF169 family)